MIALASPDILTCNLQHACLTHTDQSDLYVGPTSKHARDVQIGKCRAMQACMRRARSDRSSETIDEGSIEERKSLPVALRKESTFCLHACSMTTKGCYPSLWPPSDFSSTPPSTVANDHTSFHLHTSLKGTSSFPNYASLCLWSNK